MARCRDVGKPGPAGVDGALSGLHIAAGPGPDFIEGALGPVLAPIIVLATMSPEELHSRLLYRDDLMLVIDKPAGLAVYPGPGRGPNLEELLDALRFGLPRPPALAHRLDRDTSGCLVLGRHRKALSRLGRLFAAGRVDKTYWAVVEGQPAEPAGRIELALKKRTPERGWHMVADPAGQPAATEYRLLGASDGLAWLELKPRTGRTHQVRVHCAALGCPVLGDTIYGRPSHDAARGAGPEARANAGAGSAPLHLHARAIAVPLYPNRPPIMVTAPPPSHMLAALKACGYDAAESRGAGELAAAR